MTGSTGDRATDVILEFPDRPIWIREAPIHSRFAQPVCLPVAVAGTHALLLTVPFGSVDAWIGYVRGTWPGRFRGVVGEN